MSENTQTPEEIKAKLAKLRILPVVLAIVGLVICFTGPFTTGFPILAIGVALFLGWGTVTQKIVEQQTGDKS